MNMTTGLKIKLLRTARGLRQNELAEQSGVGNDMISYIELGRAERDAQKLLETLGYTPDMDAMLEGLAAVTGNRA